MKVSENQCLFSIIIPTYNRAHLISRAIDSVVNQTYKNWELIIVDDGSTDNTKELVENYSRKDNRVRYVYQENAERSAARNKGIENAKGEYVCFLDSDDYYLPNHLLNLSKHISSDETIYYVGLVIEKDDKLTNRHETPVNGLKLFDKLCFATIHSQQVCVPVKIAKIFKFDTSIRIAEDVELWIRMNEKYAFKFIENSFSVVVVDHDERTIDLRNNVGLEQLTTYKYIFSKNHAGNIITSGVKKILLSSTYFTIFKYWLNQKKRIQSIKYLMKSIFINPNNKQTKFKINILIRLISGSKLKNIIEFL
jgi:glycosyltransferase involved in cell wall biosynthesis